MIIELAKSRTEDMYQKCLEAIRQINEEWATYLHGRQNEFVTYAFLQLGVQRFSKVTSNGVEDVNFAISSYRNDPAINSI